MRLWTKNPGAATAQLGACGALALLACVGGVACGPATGAGRGPGTVPVSTALSQGQPGYQLAIQAIACWYGNLWAEAEGVPPPLQRLVTERRCSEVTREIFGDTARLIAFKAIEPAEVEATTRRVARDGGESGAQLSRLVLQVAAAEREALAARRASERFHGRGGRHDQAAQAQPQDEHHEIGAVEPLRAHDQLEQLLKADLGELTGDAHALGLLVALSRLNNAWALPRHLKIFAVNSVGHVVFNTPLPAEAQVAPAEATKPLRDGLLLEHLTQLAQSAGYPTPAELTPRERRMLAWQGIHKAIADRLSQQKLSRHAEPTLRPIVNSEVARLNYEFQEARKLLKLP